MNTNTNIWTGIRKYKYDYSSHTDEIKYSCAHYH